MRRISNGFVEIRVSLMLRFPVTTFISLDQALDNGANRLQIAFVGTQRGKIHRSPFHLAAKFKRIPAQIRMLGQ